MIGRDAFVGSGIAERAGQLSSLLALLRDPEWANYLHNRWRKHRLQFLSLPLELVWRVVPLLMRRWRTRLWPNINHKRKSTLSNGDRLKPFEIFCDPALTDSRAAIEHFSNRKKAQYFFSQETKRAIIEYAHEHLPGQVTEVINQADKIRQGKFPLISGVEADLSRSPNWRHPFQDLEYLFFLNRWYHGVILAKAFSYTANENYATRFVELLDDWDKANPSDTRSSVWESYSVTERMVNWILAYHLLLSSTAFRTRGMLLLLRMLEVHAQYLMDHLELTEVHNHLINNARALFEFGLMFPEMRIAERCRQVGLEILTREVERQFLPDGMLAEQSVHYHFLLMRTYAEVLLLSHKNDFILPAEFCERTRGMFQVARAFVRSDGSIPIIGDLSPDAEMTQMVGVLALGASLFGESIPVSINEYALWLLGTADVPRPKSRSLTSELCFLKHSGYAIFQSQRMHLTFRCDPKAEVVRHGHMDVFGIDLSVDNYTLIADPGNVTFVSNRWKRYFQSAWAHSTVVIDGLPPYVSPTTLRSLLAADYISAKAVITSCAETNGRVVIEAQHSGYQRLSRPVAVRRRIEIMTDQWVLIRDYVFGEKTHQMAIVFQLGLNRFDGQTVIAPDGTKLARILFRSDSALRVTTLSGQFEPQLAGWFSPAYGVQVPATTLFCSSDTSGSARVDTLIWLKSDMPPEWPNEIQASTLEGSVTGKL